MFSLLFAISASSSIWSVQVSLVATQGSSDPPPYELIVQREDPSSPGLLVDLISLRCRDSVNGEVVSVQHINFWLNRTNPNDPDLKEEDYVSISSDNRGIMFQLRDEGYYTCGMQIDSANFSESERLALISKLL